MKRMPVRRAPSRSRRNESPTNTVVSGGRMKHTESRMENRWIGFLGPDAMAVYHGCEQRSQTGAATHCFKIAVKIRHDAKPIAFIRSFQDRTITFKGGRCFR